MPCKKPVGNHKDAKVRFQASFLSARPFEYNNDEGTLKKGGINMKSYVSIDKRSKKAQKQYYSAQRSTWGSLNPVTRTVPNGKAYKRSRDKQTERKIVREFQDHSLTIFFS